MLTDIRIAGHQLASPEFDTPGDLVSWMGAVQAQEYSMVKWAVGLRLKSATLRTIDEALERGEIVRTHVMRPTWHLVAGEDIRWMLDLSGQRIKKAMESWAKGGGMEIPESLYVKCNKLMEKILEGNKSLTKQEIGEALEQAGMAMDNSYVTHLMARAETEGILCSGADRNGKPTYALLEEHVAPARELHREEALARLAIHYFRSHSPASLNDFTWWSGLSVTEAKQAVGLIDAELIRETFASLELFVHQSFSRQAKADDVLHFLPSYDEYLISYKERTTVMDLQHHSKAFNSWGIFYPVILHNGRIVGNWTKSVKKGAVTINTSFFEPDRCPDEGAIRAAEERYRAFMLK